MANTKRLRAIRQRLFDADPHCHWCGVKTVWWVRAHGHQNKPANAATLDHIVSRLDPQRYQMDYYPRELFVLACDRCNNERGKREDIHLRKVAQWKSREDLKKLLTELIPVVKSDYRNEIQIPNV